MLKFTEFVLNHYDHIWYAILIIGSGITTWLVKRKMKRRMEGLLQRKVENHELISISSWMNAMNTENNVHES
jgi:hypothetical protein